MASLTLSPVARQQFGDLDMHPLTGGKLYTYVAGTTTPLPTYRNEAGTVAHTNPIILDAGGWATIFLLPQSYKYVLTDADGSIVWTQDNISAVAPFDVDNDIIGVAGEDLDANDVAYLSDGHDATNAGFWYKADADVAASSSDAGAIALVPAAVLTGATGSFRLSGRMTGFVALTPGAKYYISDTAGSIVTPAPVNPLFARFVGVADNTGTALVIPPSPSSADAGTSALDVPQMWAFS